MERRWCGWTRERVTRDEERVLQGGWTVMRLYRYEGCMIVQTLSVNDRSLCSMRSVILSQWREWRTGLLWHDLRALRTIRARVLDLLEAVYLRLRKVLVKRITVIEFGVNDRGGKGGGCFGIEVRAYTAELTSMIIAEMRSSLKRWSVHQR